MMLKKTLKPWGYYEDIFRNETLVIKRITIFPGHRISLQVHHKRAEYWGVVSGEGELTFGDVISTILPSNTVHIPKNTIHRVKNTGKEDLVIYETQVGVCEESDIIRIEDDYAR